MRKQTLLRKYLQITIGMWILAYGMYNIHARCLISEGGILGLILLFEHWFGFLPGYTSLVLDGCSFLIGHFLLQDGFLRDSVFASVIFSVFYRVNDFLGPTMPDLSNHPLIASVLGACFVGVGIGLVMMYGIAAGGDDCLSLVFRKYTGLPVSVFYNISDGTVLLLSLSYISFLRIMYSLLTVLLSAWVIALFQQYGEKHHYYTVRKQ